MGSPAGEAGENLKRFILARIREEGPVTFFQFMAWCLYHPEYGYYNLPDVKIGREGDYFTGPCVHPLFGAMVAKQLRQMSGFLGDESFTVLEMGAGRGFLCEDIFAWAGENAPEFYRRLRYGIVELSSYFIREQKGRLFREIEKGKIFWLSPEEFKSGKFCMEGCILSNELVDAFPVHVIICEGGKLKEIYVSDVDGRFAEVTGDLSDNALEEYLSASGIGLSEGQRAEINLQAFKWLEDVDGCLRRGFVMTIDYGCLAEDLYDPARKNGTLRCFSRHKITESPYESPGSQDITSHVDFSALIRKGEELGLMFTGLTPQNRFLMAMGLPEEMEKAQKELSPVDLLKLRLSLKNLIEPELGMGEIFKVLIQHKGVEKPDLYGLKKLRDLSYR